MEGHWQARESRRGLQTQCSHLSRSALGREVIHPSRGQNRTEREHIYAESWAPQYLHPTSQERGPSSLMPLPQNPGPGGFLFPLKV